MRNLKILLLSVLMVVWRQSGSAALWLICPTGP